MYGCIGRPARIPRWSEAKSRSDARNENSIRFPVAMRLGDTPVPIPNTMVKTQAADGTMLETAWESRWLPESEKNTSGGLIAQPVRAHA